MSYEDYKRARNKAWEVLIKCKIASLPLELNLIKKYYGIIIIPYSKARNYKNFTEDTKNGEGFSIEINGQKIIYFNDNGRITERIRFTIAHELGHCLMGHDLSKTKYRNSETDNKNDSIEEMQANVFARNILMPAIVLHNINAIDYVSIMKICHVSQQSAKIREKRMKILEQRNKFCISSLEKQVYNSFQFYINNINNKL